MALQAVIKQKLQLELEPVHLEVINESQSHHNASPGAESHFKVIVVSTKFEGELEFMSELLSVLGFYGDRQQNISGGRAPLKMPSINFTAILLHLIARDRCCF